MSIYDNAYCRQQLESQGFFLTFLLTLQLCTRISNPMLKLYVPVMQFFCFWLFWFWIIFLYVFIFLTESLFFLDYLGWFSVPLNSEQWIWRFKVFWDFSCLFPTLFYLALNLRTMAWLTLGGNFAVHVV